MSVVPSDRLQKIAFYAAHQAPWTTNALAIGLTVAQMTTLSSQITAAQAAATAADNARAASKAATANFYAAVATLSTTGSSYMTAIRAFAETKHDLNVYTLAQIPAPTPGSPVGPPGTPTDFSVSLLQDGGITLKWKCANPDGAGGTIYEVRRKTAGTDTWVYVGATGLRSFQDDTVPSAVAGVTYQVTAVRSTLRGDPSQFNVNFGVGGDGLAFATVSDVTTGGGAKMAA